MPECEAEERITRALFEMEVGWGAGTFDYGKMKRILTGEKCDHAATIQVSTHTPEQAAHYSGIRRA